MHVPRLFSSEADRMHPRYKAWRDTEWKLHVISYDDLALWDELVPLKIRHCGPWSCPLEGAVRDLRPHYRRLLEGQGFVVLWRSPSQLDLEVPRQR